MFKQVKSAIFWYYLYTFRKKVLLICLLLVIALFANAIYGDIVQYLTLKNRLEFLEIALISKWGVIIFNIIYSVYLFLGFFKKGEDKEVEKKTQNKEVPKQYEKSDLKNFTQREKEFLNKKRLKTKADILVDR